MNILIQKIQALRKDEGGYLLVGCIFLVLFLSILIGSSMMRADNQLAEVQMKISKLQAFYAAETGFDRVIYELRKDTSWRPNATNPNEFHDVALTDAAGNTLGYYTLDWANAPDLGSWQSIWVRAIGDDQFKERPRSLRVRVALADPARFLVLTAGDIRVVSGTDLDSDMLGKDVYFDINPTAPNPDVNVNGNIYYLGNIHNESDPNVHFCPTCTSSQSPSITFAGVDINRYSDLTDTLSAAGKGVKVAHGTHIDINNYTTMAPPPEIIYAEGDIYVSGTYESSTLIVAEGNIYIEGNLESSVDMGGNSLYQIGLLADRDVYITDTAPNNLTVEAFIMADGDGASEGVFKALGDKYSKGSLDFKGAISVNGKGSKTAIDMNVYTSRNYGFNSELSSNNTIPYTPYIANIVEWYETNDFAQPFVAP